MKRIIPLLILILFLAMPASAANEPKNLTSISFATYIELYWDDVAGASHYSTYRYLPAMLWTDETIILDGVVDDAYLVDGANKAIAYSPNPPYDSAYDTFYILRNSTYVFMAANTLDNDLLLDDTASVYIDFDKDGLTNNVDLQYEIQEDGDVVKRKYVSGTWNSQSTGATGVVTGAGTYNPVYELWVPISELEPSFSNESWHYILIERSDSHTTPTVYNYQPRDADFTSTDGWASLNITTVANQTFFNLINTTASESTVSGLDPVDLYYLGVSSTVSGVESNQTTISVITINTPIYNVSGCIHDAETGAVIFNATVSIADGYVSGTTLSNINGQYEFTGLINDSYCITVTKEGYDTKQACTIVLGQDVENHDVFLDKTIQDEIPLSMFVFLAVIDILVIAVAFVAFDKSSITQVFSSFMATIISFMLSKIAINGQLVESFEFASTIQSAAIGYLFEYVAIIMIIITMIRVAMYTHERYQEETN